MNVLADEGIRPVIAPEKLSGYLLSESHRTGKWKAAFFRRCGVYAEEQLRALLL